MTDHHTCHPQCDCQPGTDAECDRDTEMCPRECSEGHTFEQPCVLATAQPEFKLGKPYIIPADSQVRFRQLFNEAMDAALRKMWTQFEDVLTTFPASEPPSDLARDGDGHALRERVALAIAGSRAWGHATDAHQDRRRAQADRALGVVGAANAQLRSELADMTAQRDKLHESVVHLGQKVGEVSYERNEAGRRAEAAEAERDKLREGWNELAASTARERDTAQAEVKALREEMGYARSTRDAVVEQRNRREHERDAEAYERDRERVGREAAEADADRLGESLRNELNRNGDLRAERDALQARIDYELEPIASTVVTLGCTHQHEHCWTCELCGWLGVELPFRASAAREAALHLSEKHIGPEPVLPADDSSEAAPWYCKCGDEQCLNDSDGSVCPREEGPRYRPGDWVRRIHSELLTGQVLSVVDEYNNVRVRWTRNIDRGREETISTLVLQPWAPKPGERVMGETVYGESVIGAYSGKWTDALPAALAVEVNGRSRVVQAASLRPAGGGE